MWNDDIEFCQRSLEHLIESLLPPFLLFLLLFFTYLLLLQFDFCSSILFCFRWCVFVQLCLRLNRSRNFEIIDAYTRSQDNCIESERIQYNYNEYDIEINSYRLNEVIDGCCFCCLLQLIVCLLLLFFCFFFYLRFHLVILPHRIACYNLYAALRCDHLLLYVCPV